MIVSHFQTLLISVAKMDRKKPKKMLHVVHFLYFATTLIIELWYFGCSCFLHYCLYNNERGKNRRDARTMLDPNGVSTNLISRQSMSCGGPTNAIIRRRGSNWQSLKAGVILLFLVASVTNGFTYEKCCHGWKTGERFSYSHSPPPLPRFIKLKTNLNANTADDEDYMDDYNNDNNEGDALDDNETMPIIGDDIVSDFDEDDLEGAGIMIEELNWRVAKLRLEEANTRRFLKARPIFLPYQDACDWVQAWGRRWTTAEDWYVMRWISSSCLCAFASR